MASCSSRELGCASNESIPSCTQENEKCESVDVCNKRTAIMMESSLGC